MKTIRAFCFFLMGLVLSGVLIFPSAATAGTLDLAVVQFAGLVDESTVNQSLEGQILAKATFGDRFEVKDRSLSGAPVLFSQSLTVNLGENFLSSTRLGGQRAEVEGQIGTSRLAARIALSEGVEKPLRRFSRLVYRGEGPLVQGSARVLSLRQIDSREPTVVRGKSRMETTQMTMALIYQYRR